MTQRSYKPKFLAILLFSLLALMMFTPLQATLHQNEDRLEANLADSQLSKEKVSITQNEKKDKSIGISSTQTIISRELEEGSENYISSELQKPCDNGLVVRNSNGTTIADSRKTPTDIKLIINEPGNTVPDYAFRGDTVTVEGQLYVFPGDYWNNEIVYLYYNVTKYQFESAPSDYQGNPQYEVGNGTTSGLGNFTIDLTTSVLSSSSFSKIGEIDLLAYFWGHPEAGRGSLSPGNVNVTFYGSIDLDVTIAITNPGQGYTITSQCYFDNGSVADTQGDQYTLKVEWWVSGTDFNGNRTFGIISPYNDIYSGTAPLLVQDVDITVFYNFAPLGLTFFRDNDSVDPENDRFLAYYNTTKTDNQVVVDAYFVVGISKTKTPVEVVYGSTFTVFANLTSDNGAEPSRTIRVTITGGGGVYIVEDLLTDLQAEIQKTYDLTSDVTDITDTINVHFEALSSEFGAALLNDDDLTVHYAINITTIVINLYNNPGGNFYTPGETIYYDITVIDEAGNKAPLSRFNITFPEVASMVATTEASGNKILNKIVPDFANQTAFKTIQVTALNETQATYRYNVIGVVSTNVTFNTYYDLTLTFTDPLDDPVADWTEFNNTFYSSLTAQAYNLTVRDQFGRKPLGATISITLAGYEVNNLPDGVTNDTHYVLYTVSDLDSSGLDLSIAYPAGLVITANVLPGLVYAESITHTIYIYGPDYDVPQITAEIRTPDPLVVVPHEPYFDVTFTVTASDVGTGINYVTLIYQIYEEGVGVIVIWDNITLYDIGGGQYEATLNISTMYAQNYIQYYIEVKDFAGYGLFANGTRQAVAQYDVTFGWIYLLYNSTHYNEYQIGDYEEPVEEGDPVSLTSPELDNPWFNITVFVNDSSIYTGISSVRIYVNRSVEGSGVWEENYKNGELMTNVPSTNQWFYVLNADYNYEYSWYYIAYDNANPVNNAITSITRNLAAIDSDAPVIGPGGLVVDYTGIVIEADTVLNFTIILTDERSGIQNVTVYVDYNGQTILVILTQVGTTNTYFASLDLSDYLLNETSVDPFPLDYNLLSYDIVNNLLTTPLVQLSVVNPPPVIPPGGGTELNIGALIGGVVGGLVVVIIVLFFWINRHSLQTYAKKQTLRRRLRDYLREIIEEIKRDGAEGRYKEGLIKMWNVVEGVGREFYELPRYKHQTPMEFAFLLAAKAEIQRETMATITYYFEKARYSHEPITEEDYNAGVRALLKTIDQLEISKMEIET